ncbi:hypothetical protein [Pseudomonas fluorescens]|uniref:hypothetical protein n=1 Tax=Pseudomonas fluorescens TaxID=294 RepID=UPI001242FB5D|nr:hypothetical protein [Pseudomonas fluorescens]
MAVRQHTLSTTIPDEGRLDGHHQDRASGRKSGVELSTTDLRDIEKVFATIRVQGERLAEEYMASIDR